MKGPLENIVVSGVYAVAPTRYSLFSPLSPSLHLAPRALGLQAHSLRPTLSAEGVNVQIPSRSAKRKQPKWVAFFLVAEVGFEPHDLRVMRSYIDVALVINILDRTGVVIAKPSISP